MKKHFRTYGIRIMVSVVIWLFFKITSSKGLSEIIDYGYDSLFYLIFTLFLIMTTWEINLRIYNKFQKKYEDVFQEKRILIKYAISSFSALFVVVIPSVYILEFHVEELLECDDPRNELAEFVHTGLISILIILIFIGTTIARYFYDRNRKNELIKEQIEKENLFFKYESLRSQINPHFLFNSFSVLTSLVYKNPDLASDFIAQLSKIYRYVIENKDNELASINDEIKFLKSYMYLLKIRHNDGVLLDNRLQNLPENEFIPSLSLQMLVENAPKHNKFTTEDPLILEIFVEGDMLVVRNNINKREIAEISSTGIGLKNIINRYRLGNYPSPIISESDDYFTVQLPIIRK